MCPMRVTSQPGERAGRLETSPSQDAVGLCSRKGSGMQVFLRKDTGAQGVPCLFWPLFGPRLEPGELVSVSKATEWV